MNPMKKSGNRPGKIIAGAIVVATIALLFLWKPAERTVPEALTGDWYTTDGKYADRKMEITPITISFTTGDGTVATGTIKKVTKAEEGARTLYTVEYDMDGTPNEVSFYLQFEKIKNVIRFKNQQNIEWVREENS